MITIHPIFYMLVLLGLMLLGLVLLAVEIRVWQVEDGSLLATGKATCP